MNEYVERAVKELSKEPRDEAHWYTLAWERARDSLRCHDPPYTDYLARMHCCDEILSNFELNSAPLYAVLCTESADLGCGFEHTRAVVAVLWIADAIVQYVAMIATQKCNSMRDRALDLPVCSRILILDRWCETPEFATDNSGEQSYRHLLAKWSFLRRVLLDFYATSVIGKKNLASSDPEREQLTVRCKKIFGESFIQELGDALNATSNASYTGVRKFLECHRPDRFFETPQSNLRYWYRYQMTAIEKTGRETFLETPRTYTDRMALIDSIVTKSRRRAPSPFAICASIHPESFDDRSRRHKRWAREYWNDARRASTEYAIPTCPKKLLTAVHPLAAPWTYDHLCDLETYLRRALPFNYGFRVFPSSSTLPLIGVTDSDLWFAPSASFANEELTWGEVRAYLMTRRVCIATTTPKYALDDRLLNAYDVAAYSLTEYFPIWVTMFDPVHKPCHTLLLPRSVQLRSDPPSLRAPAAVTMTVEVVGPSGLHTGDNKSDFDKSFDDAIGAPSSKPTMCRPTYHPATDVTPPVVTVEICDEHSRIPQHYRSLFKITWRASVADTSNAANSDDGDFEVTFCEHPALPASSWYWNIDFQFPPPQEVPESRRRLRQFFANKGAPVDTANLKSLAAFCCAIPTLSEPENVPEHMKSCAHFLRGVGDAPAEKATGSRTRARLDPRNVYRTSGDAIPVYLIIGGTVTVETHNKWRAQTTHNINNIARTETPFAASSHKKGLEKPIYYYEFSRDGVDKLKWRERFLLELIAEATRETRESTPSCIATMNAVIAEERIKHSNPDAASRRFSDSQLENFALALGVDKTALNSDVMGRSGVKEAVKQGASLLTDLQSTINQTFTINNTVIAITAGQESPLFIKTEGPEGADNQLMKLSIIADSRGRILTGKAKESNSDGKKIKGLLDFLMMRNKFIGNQEEVILRTENRATELFSLQDRENLRRVAKAKSSSQDPNSFMLHVFYCKTWKMIVDLDFQNHTNNLTNTAVAFVPAMSRRLIDMCRNVFDHFKDGDAWREESDITRYLLCSEINECYKDAYDQCADACKKYFANLQKLFVSGKMNRAVFAEMIDQTDDDGKVYTLEALAHRAISELVDHFNTVHRNDPSNPIGRFFDNQDRDCLRGRWIDHFMNDIAMEHWRKNNTTAADIVLSGQDVAMQIASASDDAAADAAADAPVEEYDDERLADERLAEVRDEIDDGTLAFEISSSPSPNEPDTRAAQDQQESPTNRQATVWSENFCQKRSLFAWIA
ncbi:hypothetical protein CYMTET_14281 [Cymbomonas tetramitiformis]|uniref:Uncharacterized protein n=1 Tax=Cymbomonas tetramitiformis TaxID=36881 RepID=A0AAE0LA51_9CHLO|nr:hypothetical protein CYMTET_14281 [Cymbomonas tetramitiformis]